MPAPPWQFMMSELVECYLPWCPGLPLCVTGTLEVQLVCPGSVARLLSYLSETLTSEPYASSLLLVVFGFGLYVASYLLVVDA